MVVSGSISNGVVDCLEVVKHFVSWSATGGEKGVHKPTAPAPESRPFSVKQLSCSTDVQCNKEPKH